MSFASFFHGLARMMTLPRSVRNQIKANPLTNAAQNALLNEGMNALEAIVDKDLPAGSVQNTAVKIALNDALHHSGVIYPTGRDTPGSFGG